MLTDDDLAKIAHQARQKGRRFAPTWDELAVKWPWEQETYRRIARDLRAALLPEVAPLRPGETVTIPDWATRIVLIRRDDDWRCELTGDPRGAGDVHTTAGAGPTAQGALDYVTDIAEGWRSCTLVKQEGDDGGE